MSFDLLDLAYVLATLTIPLFPLSIIAIVNF